MTPTPVKKQTIQIACESDQMSELIEDFKVAVITMFIALRGSIIKEVKASVLTMLHHGDDINKEIEIIVKDQWK